MSVDEERRKASFGPVVTPKIRVLILGSLPGERSLAAGQYYAHPQNRFWHLMSSVIDADLVAVRYDERVETLLAADVGLWDTIASACRTGSLDTAIRDAEHTALGELVATLPHLRAIGFNGAKAARIGTRLLACAGPELVNLPSSSPAFAAMPLAQKQERWLALRKFLDLPLPLTTGPRIGKP